MEIALEDVEIMSDLSLNIASVTPPASEEEVVEEFPDDEDMVGDGEGLEGTAVDENKDVKSSDGDVGEKPESS